METTDRIKLAHEPPANGTVVKVGEGLQQLFFGTPVSGDVQELLGAFNPKYVGLSTRLLMRLDPVVAFGLAITRAPLVNLRWAVDSEDPKIAAFVEWQLRRHYRNLAVGGSLAIPNGYQVLAKEWAVDDVTVKVDDDSDGTAESISFPNSWVYHRIKSIDPRTVTLLIDEDKDDWGGVEQSAPNNFGKKVRVGPEGAVLWSYRREEVWGKLTGFPLLNQVYEPWWWKTAMNLYANRYFERKADPPYKARAGVEVQGSDGRPRDGFLFMGEKVLALRNGGAIVLPGQTDERGNRIFDVELLQDDKRGDMFQSRIDSLDVQILRGLWITDKAGTSDGSGSLAMAQTHAETMALMSEATLNEWVEEVVQKQFIDPLVLMNFGEQALDESRTKLKAAGLSQSMKELLQTVMSQLLQAEQLVAEGQRVKLLDRLDGVAIANQLQLPLRPMSEVEELLKSDAAQNEEEPDEEEDPDDEAVADDLVKRGVMDEDENEEAE